MLQVVILIEHCDTTWDIGDPVARIDDCFFDQAVFAIKFCKCWDTGFEGCPALWSGRSEGKARLNGLDFLYILGNVR